MKGTPNFVISLNWLTWRWGRLRTLLFSADEWHNFRENAASGGGGDKSRQCWAYFSKLHGAAFRLRLRKVWGGVRHAAPETRHVGSIRFALLAFRALLSPRFPPKNSLLLLLQRARHSGLNFVSLSLLCRG